MESFWLDCLDRFRQELPVQQFNTWIKPLRLDVQGDQIRILAPNRFVMQWVREKYLARIESMAEEKLAGPVSITLALAEPVPERVESEPAAPAETVEAPVSGKKRVARKDPTGLNPSFTFDQFVSGKANQLARAAALQVAENPGGSYNPLFVYGGVGLGKTHLIQAIGNHALQRNSDAKISYIHAERYVSDMVRAYRYKAFDDFKRYYHSLDLLLIDDIQFFANKSQTQEEFFYAFNALIEARKQIVISCDTFPKEIDGMEDRLISRFGWGLTVAIEPPELEMRVAILLRKAAAENARLDEDVAFFIAQQVRSNVRELEGGLKRVLAHARFTGAPVSLDLAKEALKDLLAVQNRQVSVENIQKTVADYFKIKVADMYSKKRSRTVARPRQIAMALARELTSLSLPDIADAFGGRDHTTVLYACRKVAELRASEPSLGRDMEVLTQVLRS